MGFLWNSIALEMGRGYASAHPVVLKHNSLPSASLDSLQKGEAHQDSIYGRNYHSSLSRERIMIILPGKDHDSSPPADHHHGFPLIPPKTYAFWLSDFAIFLNAAQVPLKKFCEISPRCGKISQTARAVPKGIRPRKNVTDRWKICRSFDLHILMKAQIVSFRNCQGLCPR